MPWDSPTLRESCGENSPATETIVSIIKTEVIQTWQAYPPPLPRLSGPAGRGEVMAAPLIPLPESGEVSPSDLLESSRRALQLSFQRLTAGDYRQAANNVGKAIDLSTDAIAEQRSWYHGSKAMRSVVISQLCAEIGSTTEPAKALHDGRSGGYSIPDDGSNLAMYEDIIRYSFGLSEVFLQAIGQLMNEPPRPFTINSDLDAHRINQLTGHRPDVGATDALGFVNFTGEVREG